MEKLKIFVTGATGLVGFNVVKHLLGRRHRVVACVRPSSKTDNLKRLVGDLEIITAELRDRANLTRPMTGCDVVVHCAGAVDPHAKREDIFETNVAGTKSALAAAANAAVKQFIHVSSLSVITGQEDQFNVDETAALRYCGEAYADSKVEAEKAVQEYPHKGALTFTIVRPGFIYGPGERAWMPRLIESLRTRKAMLIDGGSKETNVIYVENLARAIELCLLNPNARDQVYNLTDGKTPTKKELFDAICEGMSFEPITKTIPGSVAKTACDVVSFLAPYLPPDTRKNLGRFSKAAFRLAGVNQGFSIAKAEKELNYVDRIPFSEGMKATLQSFKSESSDEVSPPVAASSRKSPD